MKKTIFKFQLSNTPGITSLLMSDKAEVISAQHQGGRDTIWAVEYIDEPKVERKFLTAWTGKEIDPNLNLKFIGTIQQNTGLVTHVFEVL